MFMYSDQKKKNVKFYKKVLTNDLDGCIVSVISNCKPKVMIGTKDKCRVLESRCLVQTGTKPY